MSWPRVKNRVDDRRGTVIMQRWLTDDDVTPKADGGRLYVLVQLDDDRGLSFGSIDGWVEEEKIGSG